MTGRKKKISNLRGKGIPITTTTFTDVDEVKDRLKEKCDVELDLHDPEPEPGTNILNAHAVAVMEIRKYENKNQNRSSYEIRFKDDPKQGHPNTGMERGRTATVRYNPANQTFYNHPEFQGWQLTFVVAECKAP